MGAGSEGNLGAGLGAPGSRDGSAPYGVEYTVRFTTNPGLLKSMEVDAQLVNVWQETFSNAHIKPQTTENVFRRPLQDICLSYVGLGIDTWHSL